MVSFVSNEPFNDEFIAKVSAPVKVSPASVFCDASFCVSSNDKKKLTVSFTELSCVRLMVPF